MEAYWDVITRIIKESDLVIEVLDARLVELSRNERVEEIISDEGKPMIFVINKTDLVSKESLRKQVEELKREGDVVFVSSKNRKSIQVLFQAIRRVFKDHGKREKTVREVGEPKPKYREAKGDIVVGVLGYPNVGKSSIINALSHKKKVKVSKKAGTTRGIHWIRANKEIKMVDSPGVIPLSKDDEIRYGLIGAKDSDKINNLEVVSHKIIELFLKVNKKNLEEFYKIEIGNEDDLDLIVDKIAKEKSFLLKKGEFDVNKTSSLIIRDWQQGRLKL